MSLVSVIIPVYNCKCFFSNCIQSLIEQTYQDLELIVVDDGSNDGVEEICDKFAEIDGRIKVFHIKNHGVSYARNYGIERAAGEYIAFVDADDIVSHRYIESLVGQMSDNELVISSYHEININNNIIKDNIIIEDELSNDINEDYYYLKFKFLLAPWGKLYRKTIIKDFSIRFDDDLSIGEDQIFNEMYLRYVNKYAIVKHCGYSYRRDSENSLSKKNTKRNFRNHIKKYDFECMLLKDYKYKYIDAVLTDVLIGIVSQYSLLSDDKNDYITWRKRVIKVIDKHNKFYSSYYIWKRLFVICMKNRILLPIYLFVVFKKLKKEGL